MAKFGSSNFGVLLVDGYNLLSAKVKGWPHEVEVELEPSEGLGDSWREHSPTGMRKATIEQQGAFFFTDTANIHAAMKDAPTTRRLVAWAVAGNVIGSIFTAVQGAYSMAYGVLSEGAKLTKANVKYEVSGALEEGVILQHHTAKTADWNTKTDGAEVDYALDPSQRAIPITSNSVANPTVVTTTIPHGLISAERVFITGSTSTPSIDGDREATVLSPTTFSVGTNVTSGGTGGSFVRANSSNGGVFHQHVSAFTGFSGFVGKVRDSPDNVTFADLVTAVNVTSAPNAQRIEVAGVVDRFVSYDGNVTGAGSVTPFSGFKRNAPTS